MATREFYYAQDQDALKAIAPLATSSALRNWFESLPLAETDSTYPVYRLFDGGAGDVYDVERREFSRVYHDTTRVCLTKHVSTGSRDEKVTFLGREVWLYKDSKGKLLPREEWSTLDKTFFGDMLGWRRMGPTSYELVQKGSRWSGNFEMANARVESSVPIDARTAEATLLGVAALMAQTQPTASGQVGLAGKLPGRLLI